VDHAGLKLPPHLSQIESRSQEELLGQMSMLLHKFLFLALEMMAAMVEMHIMLLNGCITIKSLMKHVQFIKQEAMIMVFNALSN